MSKKIDEIANTVLRRVTPKLEERAKIEALAEKLEKKVAESARKFSVKAKVRVEGSVAKDTWLSGERDVDVFMQVSSSIPRTSLGEVCLKVAKDATEDSRQIERFAEHPYLEAFVDATRVNIVPCYDSKPMEWLSATDRTPFHTDYINKRLDIKMRGEVRLLKKFMKGVGVYGAEIKIGGFSGYLCELLILYYTSFLKVVKAFAGLKKRAIIDIEGFYSDRQNEVDLLFDEPLVVVDPVDKARNVASAVRKQNLYALVAAAQAFLDQPSRDFFYPSETVRLSAAKMRNVLKSRGPSVIFVTFQKVDVVPDILWGQLYKSQRSLRKLLELGNFTVLRDFAWSDEKNLNVFGFELETCHVSPVKKHLGPPLEKELECEKFLLKHLCSPGTITGPYLEDGRWVIQVRRKFTDACALLRERLMDGGRKAGVAEGISNVLKKGFRVIVNEEIVRVHGKDKKLMIFLTEFVSGKPKWLQK